MTDSFNPYGSLKSEVFQSEKASTLREVLALINQFMFAFNYLAYSNQVVTV